jgi:hypothetical protein
MQWATGPLVQPSTVRVSMGPFLRAMSLIARNRIPTRKKGTAVARPSVSGTVWAKTNGLPGRADQRIGTGSLALGFPLSLSAPAPTSAAARSKVSALYSRSGSMPPPRSRRVRGPERSAFRTVSRTPRRAHLRPPCVAVLPRHELRPFPVEGWRRDSSRARHSISLYGGAKTMSRADHHPEPNGPNPSTEPSPGPRLDGIHLDPHEPSSTSAAPRPGHGAPENHMPCRTLAVRKRSSPMQFPDSDPLPRNPWPSPFLNHPPEQAIGLTRSVPHLAPKLQTLGESLIAPASWLPFSSAATWAPAASRTCSPREHAGYDSASIRPLRSSHSGIPMGVRGLWETRLALPLAVATPWPADRHGRVPWGWGTLA